MWGHSTWGLQHFPKKSRKKGSTLLRPGQKRRMLATAAGSLSSPRRPMDCTATPGCEYDVETRGWCQGHVLLQHLAYQTAALCSVCIWQGTMWGLTVAC